MERIQQRLVKICESKTWLIVLFFFYFSFLHRVKAELDKLQNHRNKITEENKKYLEKHPELRTLLDEFVTSVLIHKPNDIIKFGLYFFTDMRKNGSVGPCPVIISGPSGVGKGTIIEKLLKTFPNTFGFSVSHTTRGPRPGEVDGTHYHFVSKPDFEEAVERGEFVEYAKVHTNYYGTSFQAIERVKSLLLSLYLLSFLIVLSLS